MPVQTRYGSPGPLDPRARKLRISFLEDIEIRALEPNQNSAVPHPEHTILLILNTGPGVSAEPVVVHPLLQDQGLRTLIAIRPEDAQTLVRQLQKYGHSE